MVNTVPTYAIPRDVTNQIMLDTSIDVNTKIPEGVIDGFLLSAEGEFEERTGKAFRPILETEEIHDLEAHISRYPDFFSQIVWRWGIKLNATNIIQFSASRGHKIEIYEGSEPWTDWVATKTEGRNADYWVDYAKAIIWIKKPFALYRNSAVRITYEKGLLPTTLTLALTSSGGSTVTVGSTKGYQTRGVIRVGYEYISYTGKTSTTFTGCQRGKLNTDPEAHAIGDEVVQVPDNIRTLIAKRAAVTLLQSERFIAMMPEGANADYGVDKQIADWLKDWEEAMGGTYQQWNVF